MSKFRYSELKDNRLEFIKNTGVHIKIPLMWSGGLSLSEEKAIGKAMPETFDGYLEQGTRDAVNIDAVDLHPFMNVKNVKIIKSIYTNVNFVVV